MIRYLTIVEILDIHHQVTQNLSSYGADKVKLAVKERGYDWEKTSEAEREEFIDLVVHEKFSDRLNLSFWGDRA
jgi:hypothetical protein